MYATLIRHGQSTAQLDWPTKSPGSAPLTVLGQQQADAVAAYLARWAEPPSLFVTSTYFRAVLTMTASSVKLPQVPREFWPIEEFTYLSCVRFDESEGTTQSERAEASLAYWRRSDPDFIDGFGAESLYTLFARAAGMLNDLALRNEANPVLFTHGVFMKAVAWICVTKSTDVSPSIMRRFRSFCLDFEVPNTGIIKLSKSNACGWSFSIAQVVS